MKVSRALARALAQDYGVSTLFGVLGGGNLLFVDEFTQQAGATYVKNVREEGAIQGALGYSHRSGRLGVATVSHGPGFTNAITSIIEGVRSHTPMLIVASDTRRNDRHNLQFVDQPPFVLASGAGLVDVFDPATALDELDRAIRQAWVERRPVVLNVPSDVMDAYDIDYTPRKVTPPPRQRVTPDPEAVDRALGVLASAQRPLVLAGWGAMLADARSELLTLAERIGAPVATTLKAKGFFRGDPFDLGVHGTMSSTVGGEIISQADCVIAFGAGLNIYTASMGAMLDGKTIIQVDIEPRHVSKAFPATVEVIGDAKAVAELMNQMLAEANHTPSTFRSPELAAKIASYNPFDEFEDHSGDGTVDLRSFVVHLDRLLPAERNVLTDGGRFVMAPMRYLNAYEPRGFLQPLAFGSIGLAVGAAVGVAAAKPDWPTVLVLGDGCFMMSLNEFNTAVRLGQNLIVVVLNDNAYGSEYHVIKQRIGRIESTELSRFNWPSFAELATALGGRGVTVRSLDDLTEVKAALENRTGPLLIDVRVDPRKQIGFMD